MRLAAAFFATLFVTFTVVAGSVKFTNVTVVPMDGAAPISAATVVTDGDRIVYVGHTDTTEPHLTDITIDGTGKYLIPGLAEMHGHLPYSSWDKERMEDTLFLYLAGGVTTVHGMLGDSVQFDLRNQIKAGTIPGPTLYLAAPSLNGNSVSSAEDGAHQLRKHATEGWDLQKIHPGLTRAEYDAILKAGNELGFPVGGHVPSSAGVGRALAAGQISIDHMDGYMSWLGGEQRDIPQADLDHAVSMTRESGTWIVPTQALFNTFYAGDDTHPLLPKATIDALLARPENAYVPKEELARWERRARASHANPTLISNRQRLLKAFVDGGANVAMGSDAPQTFSVPGFSIWREIETLVGAGLSADQILDIGTSAPGRYFKDKDQFGTIRDGSRADLILLDADPRQDARNITKQAGVMAAGRWFSRETIDQKLAEIASRQE